MFNSKTMGDIWAVTFGLWFVFCLPFGLNFVANTEHKAIGWVILLVPFTISQIARSLHYILPERETNETN